MADDAAILDPATLDMLVAGIGRESVANLLTRFVADLRSREAAIDSIKPEDVADQAHVLRGLAGILGFMPLANLCATVEREARDHRQVHRLPELRDAMRRASAAASRYAAAA